MQDLKGDKAVDSNTNKMDNKKKTNEKGHRYTLDLTPGASEEVNRICKMFDLKIAELFRYSLLLMRIYGDAMVEGKQMRLVSRDNPNEIRVVELPLFLSQKSEEKR